MSSFIDRECVKRIASDIRMLKKNSLNEHGIYYIHNEDNILKGYALIIGPKDTIYYGGCYLFEVNFPSNYPYSPPVLKYMTNCGNVRFNPNLYRNGKVCISILNTWKGDQWTSSLTLTSILLALCTLLNEKPLLNEPGVTEQHSDYENYNKIIKFMNYSYAFIELHNKEILPSDFHIFWDVIDKNYNEKKEEIQKKIKELAKNKKERIRTRLYNMDITIDYKSIYKKISQ